MYNDSQKILSIATFVALAPNENKTETEFKSTL